jgi:ATP-dependent helicase HrpB
MQKLVDTGLPLAPRLGEICAAVAEKQGAVIRSDPGSGKSTLVPLALMERFSSGRILVLEPRRAAVWGIAARMAELLGEPLGERVGYAVRLERRVSPRTRVEVITEGLLIRRMQNDPGLTGVSTVIFDELHERSAFADLSLVLAMDLRRMGLPLNILAMSATMDAAGIAAFIGAPAIDCPGRVFPVDIEHRPLPEGALPSQTLGRAVGEALEPILSEPGGDVLVFLPGGREIEDARAKLRDAGFDRSFEILSLHGSMPAEKQRQVLSPGNGSRRRVILSTNIAETGLTIPGIALVADSGFARLERYHIPSGMNRLSMEPVSRRSADQRAGRAGRLMRGRCVRLWPENQWRPDETDPEIRRIDLSSLVLECCLWGAPNREDLPWLEPPPASSWDRALELLARLGAIDGQKRPAALGRTMAGLGLEVRLAKLCASASSLSMAGLGCAAAAILSDRDGSGLGGEADFRLRLSLLRRGDGLAPDAEAWAGRVRRTASDLLNRLGLGHESLRWTMEDEAGAGALLGEAFPDRLARRMGGTEAARHGGIEGIYRFASGRDARLEGPLSAAGWIVAAEVDAGERLGHIRLAAPLPDHAALSLLESQAVTTERIEWKGLVPRSVTAKQAFRIPLGEERRRSRREEIAAALPDLLRARGIGVLPWDEEGGRRLLDRIRFFVSRGGNAGGESSNAVYENPAILWDDETLIGDAGRWLGPFVQDDGGPAVTGRSLAEALAERLGRKAKKELDRLAPEHISSARGRRHPVDYSSGEPAVRIRLQDALGVTETEILSTPIVFHLLSPADRPIQVTRDLKGFWKGSYAGVRKEMRGRYPKHFWPEFPP